MPSEPTVFVVDDDEAIRHSLALLLTAVALPARTFPDADALLHALTPAHRGCVVADLRMPGMNGLELQDRLLDRECRLPVIFLTAHGDVPAAVRALKHGAVDFMQKPFDPQELINRVRAAMRMDAERHATAERARSVARRVSALTPREREIMEMVRHGKTSKVIALDLDISERTVEVHRARLMRKMRARTVADLVRMLSDADGGLAESVHDD